MCNLTDLNNVQDIQGDYKRSLLLETFI